VARGGVEPPTFRFSGRQGSAFARIAPVPDPHEHARLTADVRLRTVADETKVETATGAARPRPGLRGQPAQR